MSVPASDIDQTVIIESDVNFGRATSGFIVYSGGLVGECSDAAGGSIHQAAGTIIKFTRVFDHTVRIESKLAGRPVDHTGSIRAIDLKNGGR